MIEHFPERHLEVNPMERRTILRYILATGALGALPEDLTPQTAKSAILVEGNDDRFHDTATNMPCKLSGKDTNGEVAVFAVRGDPHGASVPLHVHHHQDEFWYVFEGEVLFQIGDRKMHAKVGDSLFGPREVPHSFRWLSEHAGFLMLVQPAGSMEQFFHEMALLVKEPVAPSPQRVADLFHAYGMDIVGPPVQV